MFKKTIFIVISKDIIKRNILDTPFWPKFIAENQKNCIVIIAQNGREEAYQKQFGAPNVIVRSTQKEPTTFWHKLVLFMVRTGITSHGTTLYRMRGYIMGQTKLSLTIIKTIIANTLAHFSWYHSLIRSFYSRLRLNWVESLYNEFKPDLVFVPSLIDINIDALFGVAAKRRGIRTIGMVRSWDNLVIHGLLPYVPDRFLFQNKWLKLSAEKFQSVNLSKTEHDIIGLPHYDFYKNPGNAIKDREEFCKSIGLDPNKKIIYLTGFDFYFSEDILPALLNNLIKEKKIKEPAQVLFTRHPHSPFTVEEYNFGKLPNVLYYNLFKSNIAFDNTDQLFINFVKHADVVINTSSTVTIDCAVLNRPCIAIGFDVPGKKIPYWQSVYHLHNTFDHYEEVIKTGGVRTPHSIIELLKDLNEYIADPLLDYDGRKRILDLLVEPFDGKSGERLANIMTEEIAETYSSHNTHHK
jgi:hypothetical protein